MKVKIGDKLVGENEPCFIVADIGINHNGSVDTAKQLIDHAAQAGCDAVKFQKRTIHKVYTPSELAKPRESPFGRTNGDLKWGLELSFEDYQEIDKYCKDKILWYASCWDKESVDFIEQFNPPCHKIPSPMLTHKLLSEHLRATGRALILSTGMSTLAEMGDAIRRLPDNNLIVLHCTSTYPCSLEELNLSFIPRLIEILDCPIGFSGHEVGIATSVVAVALGAKMVERHITLDRSMWGTDQSASVEPLGMEKLVKYIHSSEIAMGDGIKKVYLSEIPVKKKLRR